MFSLTILHFFVHADMQFFLHRRKRQQQEVLEPQRLLLFGTLVRGQGAGSLIPSVQHWKQLPSHGITSETELAGTLPSAMG